MDENIDSYSPNTFYAIFYIDLSNFLYHFRLDRNLCFLKYSNVVFLKAIQFCRIFVGLSLQYFLFIWIVLDSTICDIDSEKWRLADSTINYLKFALLNN